MGIFDGTPGGMVLFFVVDTSGSMTGEKIEAVNSAVEGLLPELKAVSAAEGCKIRVAALAFSDVAKWISGAPAKPDFFRWRRPVPGGVTNLGAACRALDDKLDAQAWMSGCSHAPVIFLLSDGEPTDLYRDSLEKLRQNEWFGRAIRVAVAIGDEVNREILAEFTGDMGAVVSAHSPSELKKWIRFIGVQSALASSRSAAADDPAAARRRDDEFMRELYDHANEVVDWDALDDGEAW